MSRMCTDARVTFCHALEDNRVLEGCTAEELKEAMEGGVVRGTGRRGKNMWLEMDRRPWITLHFGMSGAILFRGTKTVQYKRSIPRDEEEWPPPYHKLLLTFDNGVQMAFVDFRRFGRIRLQQNPLEEPPISELGPDAFLHLPPFPDFFSALKKRKLPLKAVLLDQGFICGIGNWVADEVLYQSRLHPEHMANTLTGEEGERLHSNIREVLKVAVEANAVSENFPKNWLFHVRWNKKKGFIEGNAIDFITVGGRTSAYVPAIQKNPGVKKRGRGKEGGEG